MYCLNMIWYKLLEIYSIRSPKIISTTNLSIQKYIYCYYYYYWRSGVFIQSQMQGCTTFYREGPRVFFSFVCYTFVTFAFRQPLLYIRKPLNIYIYILIILYTNWCNYALWGNSIYIYINHLLQNSRRWAKCKFKLNDFSVWYKLILICASIIWS